MKNQVFQLSACAMAAVLTMSLAACGGSGGDSGDSTAADTQIAITTQPAAVTVVAGLDASFSVVATGGKLSYQWRKDGVAVPGLTASKFTFAPAYSTHAGSYDVVVTNSLGSVTSTAAVLTVGIVPTITTQPVALTVAAGSPATFSVVATGSDTLTYQWRKASTNIAGATAASFTIPAVAAADAASYDVVVTNTYGTATSSVATLTVN
jgi:hypothetical protein